MLAKARARQQARALFDIHRASIADIVSVGMALTSFGAEPGVMLALLWAQPARKNIHRPYFVARLKVALAAPGCSNTEMSAAG